MTLSASNMRPPGNHVGLLISLLSARTAGQEMKSFLTLRHAAFSAFVDPPKISTHIQTLVGHRGSKTLLPFFCIASSAKSANFARFSGSPSHALDFSPPKTLAESAQMRLINHLHSKNAELSISTQFLTHHPHFL